VSENRLAGATIKKKQAHYVKDLDGHWHRPYMSLLPFTGKFVNPFKKSELFVKKTLFPRVG